MRIGVLVATGPDEGDLPLLDSVVRGAARTGDDLAFFLMDAGVAYAVDATFARWIAAGVDVTVCAHDAEAHGIDLALAQEHGVTLGSQRDHALLLRRSDHFLSFT